MKKSGIVLCIGLLLGSCSNNTETTSKNSMKGQNSEGIMAEASIDPVCGEARQANWTDYTVIGTNDTTWFCCAHDKAAYDKNPKKYVKK